MSGTLNCARIDTEFGDLLVAYTPPPGRRIVETMLNGDEASFLRSTIERSGEPPTFDPDPPAEIRDAVAAALSGSAPRERVDLSALSPFQQRVLETVAAIPRGEVRTYGEIAMEVGSPGAARAVGTALAKNPVPIVIPCHRVVRANGDLGNYSGPGGPGSKRRLLQHEGAIERPSGA